ncbi:MAG TPA: helix-turn-helix domain-containing protein [Puia sp.]|nr:helix-turn-helix domain-containing protein [Puia sp.]
MSQEINPPGGQREDGPHFTDRLLDKQDILMRMHISSRTLQTWRTKGMLPYCRIGKKIYYRESDLEKLLSRNFRFHSRDSVNTTKGGIR